MWFEGKTIVIKNTYDITHSNPQIILWLAVIVGIHIHFQEFYYYITLLLNPMSYSPLVGVITIIPLSLFIHA